MTGPFDLTGKTAVVTDASSGILQHAVSVLVDAGARVVVAARRRIALESWCGKTGDGARAVAVDVADWGAMADTIAAFPEPFGAPDIIVHAAGVNLRQSADDVTAEGWDQTFAVNLSASFFLSQALVSAKESRGWGRIVNFASLQATRAFPGGIAYGASKGGVGQLTRATAEV